jgi:hypothetical protein
MLTLYFMNQHIILLVQYGNVAKDTENASFLWGVTMRTDMESDCRTCGIQYVGQTLRTIQQIRNKIELNWIHRLGTPAPLGLNMLD